MNAKRLSPLSGLVFVVLMVAVLGFAGSPPGDRDSAAKITSFYLVHHAEQSIVSFFLAFAAVFLIVFAAALDRGLRASQPGEARLGRIVCLAGAAITAMGFLAVAAIHLALCEGVHDRISPVAAQALAALDANDWLMFSGGLGIMLTGAAAWLIPRPLARPWLGWTALVIGVVCFTPAGFLGFLASGVWIVAASIALTRDGHRPPAEAASGRPVAAAAAG